MPTVPAASTRLTTTAALVISTTPSVGYRITPEIAPSLTQATSLSTKKCMQFPRSSP